MLENDYFLNKLYNPDFNEADFKEIGLTTENTSIENKDKYKDLDFVRDNPIFQTDGQFDEAKFDSFYLNSLRSYNQFANNETSEAVLKLDFFRDDIYANFNERINLEESVIRREANPLRKKKGLIHTNDVIESPFSVREIAQTLKVWDSATNSWLDSPNESFFNNFNETRVLAQWDEDGTHKDPFTGREVLHVKGEKKINENGTYYYENLNGRNIYGREVLSKFDTLTTDGTFMNKFDFFDSDDKESNLTKNIVRNVVKVVPAFIPGVSPYYLAARVGLNVFDLMAKTGKIFAGTNSKTFNDMEGFASSLSFSSSDYALGSQEAEIAPHAWSLENLLNIGADTFTLLAELRWLFTYAPSIIKGKVPFNKKARADFKKQISSQYSKENMDKVTSRLGKVKNEKELASLISESEAMAKVNMKDHLDKFMEDYRNIGKYISQAYMTGITVGDAYGEAKQEGASDFEAALLTLGYAIGEYQIINSDLGKWILPELKEKRLGFKQVWKKLTLLDQPAKTASIPEKRKWITRVMELGKKAADFDYTSVGDMAFAGAMSEGVEEVSEEVLYDLSKSLFNVGAYLAGSDTRLSNFDNVADRYALSFVGGAIGGSLGSLKSDFLKAKQLKNMDKKLAFLELVHIVKENQQDEFLSTFDKMTWASNDLSAVDYVDEDGEIVYMKGTSKDNLNKAIKDAMVLQIKIIKDILDTNGGRVDDDSLLGILTNADKDFRFLALQRSSFAPMYLLELNTIDSKIVELVNIINNNYNLKSDSLKRKLNEEEETVEDAVNEEKVKEAKKELKLLLKLKEDLISGKRTGEYIAKALWEMNTDVSSNYIKTDFISWAEDKEGKPVSLIPKKVLNDLEQLWKEYCASPQRKDDLELGYQNFMKLNPVLSEVIKKHSEQFFNLANDQNSFQLLVHSLENRTGADLNILDDEEYALKVQEQYGRVLNYSILESAKAGLAEILIGKLGKIDKDLYQKFLNRYQNIAEINENGAKETEVNLLLKDLMLIKPLANSFIEDIKNVNFLNYTERILLQEAFKFPLDLSTFDIIRKEIDEKNYSPILDLIDGWSDLAGNQEMPTSKLIQTLEYQLLEGDNIQTFNLSPTNASQIDTALKNIQLIKASIMAARTDSVTVANRVGYNVTVNLLLGTDLAEIDKNTANVLIQEVVKVENKLKFFKRIQEINLGQKLTEHNKVFANKAIITYNKVKKLVFESLNWPPEDWESDNLLKDLSDFEIIDLLETDGERKLNLTVEEKVKLRRDLIKIDNAFYKFFQLNKNKLLDVDALSNLIDSEIFSLEEVLDNLLTSDTKELDDRNFIAWLASRAALNPNDFYMQFKNSITEDLAPVPGQEEAIHMALVAVLNGEVFANFGKAYNKSLAKKISSMDESIFDDEDFKKKRTLTKSDFLDSDVAIQFLRTFVITGVAGSGKSTGVLRPIIHMLRKSELGKQLLEDIWFVNTSKERALLQAKELGFTDEEFLKNNCFSKLEVLEKIAPGISDIRKIKDDRIDLDLDDLYQKEGTTLYRYKKDFVKSIKKPSMLIMDEITGFSQQDMLLIEDFSEYFGIVNLGIGDFKQSGLMGNTKLDNETVLYSELYKDNFFGSMKMGSSIRTQNRWKDYNRVIFEALQDDLMYNPEFAEDLFFKYYLDEKTILGDKIYDGNDDEELEEIKEDIKLLLNNLEKGDKIGFIYDNEESELYKYVQDLNNSSEYKNKFDFKYGSSSLGEERNFYVMDIKNELSDEDNDARLRQKKFWRDFYTGLTRSKKGSLIRVTNIEKVSRQINSEPDTGEYDFGGKPLLDYINSVKEVLEKSVEEGGELQYKQFKGTVTNTDVPEGTEIDIDGTKYSVIDLLNPPLEIGTEYKIEESDPITTVKGYLKDSDGKEFIWLSGLKEEAMDLESFKLNILPNINLTAETPGSTFESDEYKNLDEANSDDSKIDIDNDDESVFNMLLHSNATEESGFILEDGKLIASECYENRIDSLNGICKILNLPIQAGLELSDVLASMLVEKLREIRSSALYRKDKSDIIKDLKRILKHKEGNAFVEPENLEISYIFKSSNMPGKVDEAKEADMSKWGDFKRFAKYVKESILSYFGKDSKSAEPLQKTISMLVTTKVTTVDKKGKTHILRKGILEIPMACLTNPITLLDSNVNGFLDLKAVATKVKQQLKGVNPKPSSLDYLNKVKEEILKSKTPIKHKDNFLKLLDIYFRLGNKVARLDDFDNPKAFASYFDSTGPLVITKPKGTHYYDEILQYNGEWMDLTTYKKKSGMIISDVIATNLQILDPVTKETAIIKGHPFVLVSDAHVMLSSTSTEALFAQFKKLLQDENEPKLVKVVYVAPPSSSVLDYLKNMNKVYLKKGKDEVDLSIGTVFTSFDILSKILQEDFLKDKLLDFLKALYEKFKAKVAEIQKKRDVLSSVDFRTFLEGDEGLQEFARSLNSKGKGTTIKSWKNYLLGYLRQLVLSHPDNVGNKYFDFKEYENPKDKVQQIIKDKIDAVVQFLADRGIPGVFYHMHPSKTAAKNADFMYLDTKDAMFKNLSVRINGKIDSLVFKGNVLPMLDTIINSLNNIIPKSGGNNEDTLQYVQDSYPEGNLTNNDAKLEQKRITTTVNLFMNSMIISKANPKEAKELKNVVTDFVKDDKNANLEKLKKHLNDKKYYVRNLSDGKMIVLKIDIKDVENVKILDEDTLEVDNVRYIYDENSSSIDNVELVFSPETSNNDPVEINSNALYAIAGDYLFDLLNYNILDDENFENIGVAQIDFNNMALLDSNMDLLSDLIDKLQIPNGDLNTTEEDMQNTHDSFVKDLEYSDAYKNDPESLEKVIKALDALYDFVLAKYNLIYGITTESEESSESEESEEPKENLCSIILN